MRKSKSGTRRPSCLNQCSAMGLRRNGMQYRLNCVIQYPLLQPSSVSIQNRLPFTVTLVPNLRTLGKNIKTRTFTYSFNYSVFAPSDPYTSFHSHSLSTKSHFRFLPSKITTYQNLSLLLVGCNAVLGYNLKELS